MKKSIIILLALLLGLVSCTEPLFNEQNPENTGSGKVAVTMELTIPSVQIQALTKAKDMSHKPQIDYIRVAVFGTSGYPQAYSLAEPVGSYATENDDGTTNTTYKFNVLLPVYEGEAHVHIIANGDESISFDAQTEASVMSSMYTENNVGAFWTRVILENGILPEAGDYGIYRTDDTPEHNFVPSEETKNAFKNLVLVRNFAEVSLFFETNDQGQSVVNNLSEVTWMLVNVPKRGSVIPMMEDNSYEWGFVWDYVDYDFDTTTGRMKKEGKFYDGFMYEGDSVDESYPSVEEINNNGGLALSLSDKGYLYERVKPTGEEKATCILMRARFGSDNYFTYYRLDLTAEALGGYFPIYRNYSYQMRIHKVNNRGARTPGEAMNRDSGGNVSQSTEAKKLTDISDGTSRLYVEYVEKNFTEGGTARFWVYYKPDVEHNPNTINNESITVKVTPGGNALVNGGTEQNPLYLTPISGSSQTGKYYYEFELNDNSSSTEDLVSHLEVTATNGETGDDRSTLYRDITLRVLHTMQMTLQLRPSQLSGDDKITLLDITLPDNLPSSMFPLEFHIEDVNHTLSPTQKDGSDGNITVPVKTGLSLADGTTNSFYYIRTVNESEYNTSHTITTQFEAIKDPSATTIYVANEYFDTKSINLLNDGLYVNPTNQTVASYVTESEIQIESVDSESGWSVTPGNGVTLEVVSGTATLSDGVLSGTGNGKFKMKYAANYDTENYARWTATVSSEGVEVQTITITQSPLVFSLSSDTEQPVVFTATTAIVKVNAPEGVSWRATVNNEASFANPDSPAVPAVVTGTGPARLTVNIPKNTTTSQRIFTVSAVTTDEQVDGSDSIQIRQSRGPNTNPATFNYNGFGITLTTHSGSAISNDSFVTVSLTNATRRDQNGWEGYSYQWAWSYIRMSNSGTAGSVTVTPGNGIKITKVVIYYASGYVENNPSVTEGQPAPTVSGNTLTWDNLSATSPITLTHSQGGDNTAAHITSIQVTYEAI